MKTKLQKATIFFVVLAIGFASCSDDDDNLSNNDVKTEIENNVKNNAWRITKYIDSGDDELNHFTGYNFTFGDGNVLTANNGTNNYTGTWSVSSSNSSDDSQDDLHFNIFFASPSDFQELSDDWDIVSQSSVKIELIDVSGGNGGTDYLTFEKN